MNTFLRKRTLSGARLLRLAQNQLPLIINRKKVIGLTIEIRTIKPVLCSRQELLFYFTKDHNISNISFVYYTCKCIPVKQFFVAFRNVIIFAIFVII